MQTDANRSEGKLSVLILTHNEESNIGKCLRSLLPLDPAIYIVDSGSTDATLDICRSYGAAVVHHDWKSHADQFNWGLDQFAFTTGWIMRMDADEEVTPELARILREFLRQPPADVSGVWVRRRVHFMGRWIRHGGYYPTWLLRVFRAGLGRCEQRWMDEHIVVSAGTTIRLPADIIDDNTKDLTFWTDKHNHYADREVMDLIARENAGGSDSTLPGGQARARRWLKYKVYGRVPLFVRPLLYFLYRYFLRLGFLDGKEGLIFHFLQGFWYRFLVDAKLFEYRRGRGRVSRQVAGAPR
jgi:glycosyltransferase involved in cell wall biosynthesis